MTEAAPLPLPPPHAAPRPAIVRARDAVADSVRFFTRFPVPAGWGSDGFDGVAVASPLGGALVGMAAASGLVVALAIGLPPLAAAVAAAALGLAASGGLHLDGLADVADGFGGGATQDRKLEIMRDSRLGVFGGAAVALSLFARIALAAALVDRLGAAGAALGLIAAAALARPLALLPAVTLQPARDDGLGRSARPRARSVAAGCALGALAALLFGGPAAALAAAALAAAAAAGVAATTRRQVGGYTGDVCGAAAELAEIAALIGMLAAASP